MQALTLATMFLAGLFGSAHCLTMCGGLATALAAAPMGGRRLRIVLYQGGRLLSYGLLGAAAGGLGMSGSVHLAAERWSALLRAATALFIVAVGLRLALGTNQSGRWLRLPERIGARIWRRLSPSAQRALPQQPYLRAVALGMLWGWMPCGLIYTTLMAAAVAGGAFNGLLTMLAFGLGTVPAVLGMGQLAALLPQQGSQQVRVLGVVLVACGLWTAVLPIAALRGYGPMHHHGMAMLPPADEAPTLTGRH